MHKQTSTNSKLNITHFIIVVWAVLVASCATMPSTESGLMSTATDIPTVEEMILEGDKAMQEGDIDAAQVSYALAVEKAPDNVDALYKLGFVHNEKSSLSVAESILRHALQEDPEHQASKQTLAMVLMKAERLDEAEAVLKQLLETNMSAWEAHNGLGVVHDMRGRHTEAQRHFFEADRYRPRSPRVFNNLGYSFYMSGDYVRAEEFLKRAIQYDAGYKRAWSNLALLYSREGRYRDASAAFRKIVGQHQAANNLGYLGLLQGDDSFAREQLSEAIRLSPVYYEIANRNLESLDDGNIRRPTRSQTNIGSAKPQTIEKGAASQGPIALLPRAEITDLSSNSAPQKEDILSMTTAQLYLNFTGFDAGEINGLKTDQTRAAILDFQRVNYLKEDGKVGVNTSKALNSAAISKIQRSLRFADYKILAVNGRMDTSTKRAIGAFQADHGLLVSNEINRELINALVEQKKKAREEFNSPDTPDLTARG